MSDTNQNGETGFGRDGASGAKGPIIPKSANEALRPERVPDPPRRSRKARSQLVIFLNFLMTVIVFTTLVNPEVLERVTTANALYLDLFGAFVKPLVDAAKSV